MVMMIKTITLQYVYNVLTFMVIPLYQSTKLFFSRTASVCTTSYVCSTINYNVYMPIAYILYYDLRMTKNKIILCQLFRLLCGRHATVLENRFCASPCKFTTLCHIRIIFVSSVSTVSRVQNSRTLSSSLWPVLRIRCRIDMISH